MKHQMGNRGLWLVVLIGLLSPANVIAQDKQLSTVTVGEGQSLRDIAQEYLGDPDLWTEILRANGLSVADVHPGSKLKIPVGQVAAANKALADALDRIQQATEQGARLFAAQQIGQALKLRDAALAKRKAGDWDAATKLAGDAGRAADAALKAALAERDAAADALLSDRQGWVEGQRPQDLVWTDRQLNAILIEDEKVRTRPRRSPSRTRAGCA
jgi:hypothetical protein